MANRYLPSALARGQIDSQVVPLKGWRRLRMVVILGALSAFGLLSIDMYLPSLPSLSRDLQEQTEGIDNARVRQRQSECTAHAHGETADHTAGTEHLPRWSQLPQ